MKSNSVNLVNDPDRNPTVWRYTSLAKLLNVLLRGDQPGYGEFITKRTDQFEDTYNGTLSTVPGAQLEEDVRMTYEALYDDSFDVASLHSEKAQRYAKRDLDEGPQRWVRNAFESFERSRAVSFLNSWYKDQYESSAMWRAYTTPTDGVVLKSSFDALVSAAEEWDGGLYCGEVEYIDDVTASIDGLEIDVISPFFQKQREFTNDSEVRLLVTALMKETVNIIKGTDEMPEPQESIRPITFDMEALVDEVRVHPEAHGFGTAVISEALDRFGLTVQVTESSLERG